MRRFNHKFGGDDPPLPDDRGKFFQERPWQSLQRQSRLQRHAKKLTHRGAIILDSCPLTCFIRRSVTGPRPGQRNSGGQRPVLFHGGEVY